VSAIVLLPRKERLQVAHQNLVEHRLFGLARAMGLSPATDAGTRETSLRQTLHGRTVFACRLPFADSFQPRIYGRPPLKDRGKHDNLFRVFDNKSCSSDRYPDPQLRGSRTNSYKSDPCGRFNYSQSRPQDEQQYIGKVDLQLTPNHSMFGRVIETRVKWTPPLELRPENILVSSQGGRDNKAHAITVGDTLVINNNTVNAVRVAYNKTDIHRIHEPIGFSAPDVGVNTYSYLEDYLLVNVTGGGFQLGGGTESEARFTTPAWQVNDDLTMIRGSHQFAVGATVARWTSL
jgi:hypothetical protein